MEKQPKQNTAENPPLWNSKEIALATQGEWLNTSGEKTLNINNIHYLNRAREGDLVFTRYADWGPKYQDTRDNLPDFLAQGATAAVIEKMPSNAPKDLPLLKVKNSRQALDNIAASSRTRFKGKIIAITGSVGKTSTKEALLHLLGEIAPTYASDKNFNHAPGISVSLSQLPADFSYGVFEFAVDAPQRTLPKAQLLKPHVAVITNIHPAHLAFYPTLKAIADQKSLLFDGLAANGTVILNRDMHCFDRILINAIGKGIKHIVTFGESPLSDVRLVRYKLFENKSKITIEIQGKKINYELASPGKHNVFNSITALTVISALGEDIKKAIRTFKTLPPSCSDIKKQRIPFKKGYIDIFDDTFNSSPAAMLASFGYLTLVTPSSKKGRKMVILGDIKELGEDSQKIHTGLAQPIIDAGIDKVFTFGEPDVIALFDALPESHQGIYTNDTNELINALFAELKAGDIVLIKASAKIKKETRRIIQTLTHANELSPIYTQKSFKFPASKKHREINLNIKRKADVLFLGDTSFGENYQEKLEKAGKENILKKEGYQYSLKKMKSILKDADLVVANLETPITNLNVSPFTNKKSYVHWADIKQTPKNLLKHNITTVSLANNHSFDYGAEGFAQTIKILHKNKFNYFGVGENREDANKPLIINIKHEKQIRKIAVFASFQEFESYRNEYNVYADQKTAGINPLKTECIASEIKTLKNDHPEIFVICFPHWRPNYKAVTANQKLLAEELLAAGADLIIGHGAHMMQAIEKKYGHWVLYSIGNFMFNSPGRYATYEASPYSLIAKLMIQASKEKLSYSIRLYPIVTDNKLTNYQPRFVMEEEFDIVCDLIEKQATSPDTHAHSLSRGKDKAGYYLDLPIEQTFQPSQKLVEEIALAYKKNMKFS